MNCQVAEVPLVESKYCSIACTSLRVRYRKSINIFPELGLTHCVTLGKLPSQVLRALICEMNRLDKLIT